MVFERITVEREELLRVVDEFATESDVDGGFLFVPGQHPHPYPGLAHHEDCFRYLVLKSVFNRRRADEVKIYDWVKKWTQQIYN